MHCASNRIGIQSVESNTWYTVCGAINKKDVLFLETKGGSGLLLGSGLIVRSP